MVIISLVEFSHHRSQTGMENVQWYKMLVKKYISGLQYLEGVDTESSQNHDTGKIRKCFESFLEKLSKNRGDQR